MGLYPLYTHAGFASILQPRLLKHPKPSKLRSVGIHCHKKTMIGEGRQNCVWPRGFTSPLKSGLLLLFGAILTWPIATVLSRVSSVGMGVLAKPCVSETTTSSLAPEKGRGKKLYVNASNVHLLKELNCEGGVFEVNWTGVVNVTDSIVIGSGTQVTITGQGFLTTAEDSTASTSTDSTNGTGQNGKLGELTRQLVLPQGLVASAVGVVSQESIDSNTNTAFGPIFDVQKGGMLSITRMIVSGGLVAGGTPRGWAGISAAKESNVFVTECEFSDTFAEYNGGGIHVEQSVLQVADSLFTRCWVGFNSQGDDDEPDGKGGAIHVRTNPTIEGVMFFSGLFP